MQPFKLLASALLLALAALFYGFLEGIVSALADLRETEVMHVAVVVVSVVDTHEAT